MLPGPPAYAAPGGSDVAPGLSVRLGAEVLTGRAGAPLADTPGEGVFLVGSAGAPKSSVLDSSC